MIMLCMKKWTISSDYDDYRIKGCMKISVFFMSVCRYVSIHKWQIAAEKNDL